jgi:uncharacterized membrane protein YidH (DUF202 family)
MNPDMPTRPEGTVTHEAEKLADAIPAEASDVRAEHWFQRFARFGLSTRAIIYALLAYIATDLGLRHTSSAEANGSGALSEVGRQPAGRALLVFLAIGLAGYALWRMAQALSRQEDGDKHRPASKEISAIERVGWICTAIVYFVLCGQAVAQVASSSQTGSGGGGPASHPQPFVATVLKWPAGPVWVGLVGAGLAAGGAALAVWGGMHDYAQVLETHRMKRWAFHAAQVSGFIGEATRGLLVVLVSLYLLAAAIADNPSRAKSPNGALLSFERLPAGEALLLVAAAGLLSFAVYSVLEALYRRL